MKVLVASRVKTRAIDAAAVRRAAVYVMRKSGCPEGTELGILFAGDRAMRTLNRRYRGVDRGTDVLAFPLADTGARGRARLLGDVAISPGRARACAGSLGTTAGAELLLYLVHGILHLCGYDDGAPRPRAKMERRQRLLVAAILRKGLWNVTG
ncbi:MAG: rRNA maturation RNase YbeY [Chlamydiota bacterium]